MKPDLIIDFDNTIGNSSQAAIDVFCQKHNRTPIKLERNKLQWDWAPYLSPEEAKETLKYFALPEMYAALDFVDEYFIPVIKQLSEKYNIIICSKRDKGCYTPLVEWLETNMPCEYATCFVSTFDKSFVGRPGSIIIDDKPRCLLGNNDRSLKILFGTWKYTALEALDILPEQSIEFAKNLKIADNWKEVGEILLDESRTD
ncbi:MAG: hypothetical protein HUJ68_03495 [Clostridia bacterium]|nr:hypothetical protein [Clostridia bacterium]